MKAPITKHDSRTDPCPAASVVRRSLCSASLAGLSRPLTRGRTSLPALIILFYVACLIATPMATRVSHAQGGEEYDPFAGIEEMVVVGTGAASLFQNQEVSAIAFDADYLEAIGANDLTDVATFTPNLEIRTPFAASNPTLFIRGVGLRDFNANSSSSVAVYNDEIYLNSPAGQLAQLFDTQNIDVLRGPQTTMYARNASAGTIRVVSRKPTGTPGATGSVTYGRFQELNFEAAVENVIVPDMLTMRSSGKWNQRVGHTKNRCADISYASVSQPPRPGSPNSAGFARRALIREVWNNCFAADNTNPANSPPTNGWTRGEVAPVKEWVNDTKNWAARTIIRFEHPFLDMDWQLNLHGGQNRGDARQFQLVAAEQPQGQLAPQPTTGDRDLSGYLDADNRQFTSGGRFNPITSPFQGDPFAGDYNQIQKEKIDLFGGSLTGEMTTGDFVINAIAGYEWNKRDTTLNLDGSPFTTLEPDLYNKSYQLTAEMRINWDDGGGFAWQLGGMFLYESLEVSNQFSLSPLQDRTSQQYGFLTRYAAVWGSIDWELNENFQIHAGARLNYEDKELNLTSQRFTVLAGGDALRLRPSSIESHVSSAAREEGWAGDIIATYTPAPDVSFYMRYARGWKGPHINGGILNPGPEDSERGDLATPVEPEKIDSIEMGLKAEFFANRVRWNWAFFYYDYQDIQVFQLRNAGGSVPVQELINADDADVFGVEMEVDVKPFEGWAHPILEQLWIRGTFAYLDSKYTDFVNVQEIVVVSGGVVSKRTVTEDFSGKQLVNSPKFSFIGFVAWPIGGDWGTVIPRFDWSFKDTVYFGAANAEFVKQDPLWLMNVRVTYQSPSETFQVSAWVKNLTDQAYTVDVFNLARVREAILHAIGDPITYGLTLKVSF